MISVYSKIKTGRLYSKGLNSDDLLIAGERNDEVICLDLSIL